MTEKIKKTTDETLPGSYQMVLSLIPYGSDNPIKVQQIQQLTGLKDTAVREIVTDLIVTYKKPIGTSNISRKSGYYMITSDDERDNTVRNLKSRAFKILKRATVLEQIPNENQMKLEDIC